MATKPLNPDHRGKKGMIEKYGKIRCPQCGGIDTRRYSARGYAYCFNCDIEIPLPEREWYGNTPE